MISVMFVDDEANVLTGLRRMLYPMHKEWDIRYANSGEIALGLLEEHPVDVFVSDMRMPQMDGATLLRIVRDRYPETARIALSGYSEMDMIVRSVPVAHQFLSKPCESQRLKASIERSYTLLQRLHRPELRAHIAQLQGLPTPTPIIQQLNEALFEPDTALDKIAKLIADDAALTAKLLQLVNSAFFGLPREIANSHEAVSYLGLSTLRNLATTVELFDVALGTSEQIATTTELHTHSLSVAALARELMIDPADKETAFVAGILHDIGALIISATEPGSFGQLRSKAQESGRSVIDFENEILGASHAEIGASLLELWGLPHNVIEAVLTHHDDLSIDNAADQPPLEGLSVNDAVIIAERLVSSGKTIEPTAWEAPLAAIDPAWISSLGLKNFQ